MILCAALALSLAACGREVEPDETEFVWSRNNWDLIAPDGTRYKNIGSEIYFAFFGVLFDDFFSIKDSDTRLCPLEGDAENNVLFCYYPYSLSHGVLYRKASLPTLKLTPDNCIRFEYFDWEYLKSTEYYKPEIEHMSCGEGIADREEVSKFLSDVRSQEYTGERGDSIGYVYGYFEGEANLAMCYDVYEHDNGTYSITLTSRNRSIFAQLTNSVYSETTYVLPEKWLDALKGH